MTKKEFIEEYSKKSNLNKKKSEVFVNNFLKIIEETLSKGEEVKFIGFGSWKVKKRAPKEVMNPNTGKKIKVGPKNIVKFKVGKNLVTEIGKYI